MHGFPAKWKSNHVRSQLAGNMTLYRCPPNWKCKHPIMQFPVSWKFKLYNILLVSYVEVKVAAGWDITQVTYKMLPINYI